MYLDFIKNNYEDKEPSQRVAYIARDKTALSEIVQDKISKTVEQIVDRWYELDDIGYISQNEKFLDLLHEAEQLYCFGFYTGTISIIGIACEEYCKFLVDAHGIPEVKTQNERINALYENQRIDSNLKNLLHRVRKIRNDCIHYDLAFKTLDENQLKASALEIISLYKTCLLPLASNIDNSSEEKIIEEFISSKEKSFREYIFKHRNMIKKVRGLDLQISPDIENMKFTSLYYIAEIDISTDAFKEMTLVDLGRKTPAMVVIDLTLPQSEILDQLKLKEGNLMVATIISSVSAIGQTEEWHLLKIEDICKTTFNIDEINNFDFTSI